MTQPDIKDLAKKCRDIAKRIDLEADPGLRRTADWKLDPTSSNEGPSSIGDHSSPTEVAALNARREAVRLVNGKLKASIRGLDSALDWVASMLTEAAAANPKDRATDNNLEKVNTLAGYCHVHETAGVPSREHSGQGNDRLKRITTGERDADGPICPLMCSGCASAWERRPYSDASLGVYQEWEPWLADRTHHLQTKASAA